MDQEAQWGDILSSRGTTLALQPTMVVLRALPCSLGLSSRPTAAAMGAAMETPTLACLATCRQQAAITTPLRARHLPREACPCSSRGMASPHPQQVGPASGLQLLHTITATAAR